MLYLLNFLDRYVIRIPRRVYTRHRANRPRQNLSSAKIAGLTDDLGLTAQQYGTCVAVLFAGYISLQIPSNMIASKVGITVVVRSVLTV